MLLGDIAVIYVRRCHAGYTPSPKSRKMMTPRGVGIAMQLRHRIPHLRALLIVRVRNQLPALAAHIHSHLFLVHTLVNLVKHHFPDNVLTPSYPHLVPPIHSIDRAPTRLENPNQPASNSILSRNSRSPPPGSLLRSLVCTAFSIARFLAG